MGCRLTLSGIQKIDLMVHRLGMLVKISSDAGQWLRANPLHEVGGWVGGGEKLSESPTEVLSYSGDTRALPGCGEPLGSIVED